MEEVKRTYIPGDRWAYFKIYTGVKTADFILRNTIPDILNHLLERELVIKWFFIRYTDPEYHLRLRFYLTNIQHLGSVIHVVSTAFQQYLQDGTVWKIQMDTYQRELERYGMDTMELSECLFSHDSNTFLEILQAIQQGDKETLRWQAALASVDHLLNDFELNLERKLAFVSFMKQLFAEEFKLGPLKGFLSAKYRMYKKDVEKILGADSEIHQDIFNILQNRSVQQKPVINEIIKKISDAGVLNRLLDSYIHMMLNRWFNSKQRMHEIGRAHV